MLVINNIQKYENTKSETYKLEMKLYCCNFVVNKPIKINLR